MILKNTRDPFTGTGLPKQRSGAFCTTHIAAALIALSVAFGQSSVNAQSTQNASPAEVEALLGRSNNTSEVLEELGPLAAAGDVRAQAQLGRALLRGEGIAQDVATGVALLEAAAAAGSGEAWFRLGEAYSDGRFLPVNAVRALESYKRAISLGTSQAYVGLGRLFEGAPGISSDPEAAIAAYQAAISAGVGTRAQIALAQGHLRGRFGELSDPTLGEELYRQLALADDLTAQIQLGLALLSGDELEQDLEAGIGLLEAAAESGSAEAWQRLGDAYSRGDNFEVDGPRALEAYQVAVALGNTRAYLEIGRVLQSAVGVPADPQGAIDAYEAAAVSDDPNLRERAELALAQGHLLGTFGLLSDPQVALDLYNRLVDSGSAAAKIELGVSLIQGDRITHDTDRGLALLRNAAVEGSVEAWMRLGDLFSTGEFVELDGAAALDAYNQAATLGFDWAYLEIGRVLEGGAGLQADPAGAIAAYTAAVSSADADLSARASTRLAQGHLRGRFGALSDPSVGLDISDTLASAGDTAAKVRLAQALLAGEDTDQDIERGLSLLEEAAEAGSPEAWFALGDAFSNGETIEIDVDRALAAYDEAVRLGDPWAYLRIGRILLGDEASGRLADPYGALAAYESAVATGEPDLRARAELALAQGHLAGHFGDFSDTFEAERLYLRLIEVGQVPAIVQLGRALLAGDGVDQDVPRGIQLLEAAGAKGSADAWFRLGDAYSNGQYLDFDGQRAVQAYEEAIALGSDWGNLQLARLLEGQLGVKAEPERAFALYETAVATGAPELRLRAEVALAQGHLTGRFGSLSDREEGLRIFDTLAGSGNPIAQIQLGVLLLRGDDIPQDVSGGVEFLLSAAEQNDRARRELIFGLIRVNPQTRPEVRQRLLDYYESFSVERPEYIRFLATISANRIDYGSVWQIFLKLPADQQTQVLTAAAISDRKVYAGLLQGTMAATGDLNGGVDGLFGPATLRAYIRFCPKVAPSQLCERGPFFNETRAALVQRIPDLLEKEGLTQ